MSDEFDFEPVPGLPESLPEGEQLRWQGAPQWGALAVRAFHARSVALYFGLLIVLRMAYLLVSGAPLKVVLLSGLWLGILCVLAVGILVLLALAFAKSTVYSITDRRVVIRFGVALPMAVNIPFKAIESAGLRRNPGGIGDIPMTLGAGHNVNYLILWPNVRPWQFFDAQPMLRCVPEVDRVAEILAEALREAAASEPEEASREVSATIEDHKPGHARENTDGSPQLGAAPATGQ